MESDRFGCPKIRQTLDLASKEILMRKPDRALELIESIREDVE